MRTWRTTIAVIGALALGLVANNAWAGKLKRLSDTELVHFEALKVWFVDGEEKEYLKGKTEEERSTWLKDRGYWDRFYQYDQLKREQIAAGQVGVGWTYDQVYMAWGEPHAKKRMAGRPATRSELYIYRFEVDWTGATHVWTPNSKLTRTAIELFQLDVYVDDGRVAEIVRKEDWE